MKKSITKEAVKVLDEIYFYGISHFKKELSKRKAVPGITKKEITKEVRRKGKIRKERKKRQARQTVRKHIHNGICERFGNFAKHLIDSGYAMGEIKEIRCPKIGVINYYNNTSDYAKSCTWKAKHGSVVLNLTPSELRRTKLIGGVITIIGKRDKHKGFNALKRCVVITGDGRTYLRTVKRMECFVKGSSHGSTKEICVRNYKVSKEILKKKNLRKKEANRILREGRKRFYSFNDSIKAGNCSIGTKVFIERNNLNSEFGYRGDFLLEIAKDQRSFIEKMFLKKLVGEK